MRKQPLLDPATKERSLQARKSNLSKSVDDWLEGAKFKCPSDKVKSIRYVFEHMPARLRANYIKALEGKLSFRRLVRLNCAMCTGYCQPEVENCTVYSCVWWPKRLRSPRLSERNARDIAGPNNRQKGG